MAKNIIAALDIGSSKITAIIASVEDDGKPQVIGVATHPSNGLKKGVVVNIDESIKSIAECLEAAERMAGLTVSSVYASISGKHIASTNNRGVVAISKDEIGTEDVQRAIESARTVSIPPSREILHVIPREFLVDAQGGIKDPIGMSGTRLEVDCHIVSATTTALHNLVKSIQQVGLAIDDIVFSAWAASGAVLTPTEKELGVMLLDIGGGTTGINIFADDAICYSGCLPVGGGNITSDLAIGLRISLDDAEKIKSNIIEILSKKKEKSVDYDVPPIARKAMEEKKSDDAENNEEDTDMVDVSHLNIEGLETVSRIFIQEIVEARLEEVFNLVASQVIQAGFDTNMPAGIVLTGGTALLPGINKTAQKVFGVPVRIGYPSGLSGLVDEISGPDFATGQGLILYGVENERQSISSGGGFGQVAQAGGGLVQKVTSWFKSLLP